jgi:hypothetical protein
MTAPGAARYLVELLPIAFLPSGHAMNLCESLLLSTCLLPRWMLRVPKRFTEHLVVHRESAAKANATRRRYDTSPTTVHFPRLLFQTRYGGDCCAVGGPAQIAPYDRGRAGYASPGAGRLLAPLPSLALGTSRAGGSPLKLALYYASSRNAPSENAPVRTHCRSLS